MNKSDSKQLDEVFSALGNSKRRGMVNALSYRPSTVAQLAEEFKLSLPAIHKHIRTLEQARLIQRRKVGRVNFLAINRKGLELAKGWLSGYHTEWGNDSESLENYIEKFKQESGS